MSRDMEKITSIQKAATEVNGNTKKTDLTESPFLIMFEFGGN